MSKGYGRWGGVGDKVGKVRVIGNDMCRRDVKEIKDLWVMDGDGCD